MYVPSIVSLLQSCLLTLMPIDVNLLFLHPLLSFASCACFGIDLDLEADIESLESLDVVNQDL